MRWSLAHASVTMLAMKNLPGAVVVIGVLVGCSGGSGSGLSSSKRIVDLSADEESDLCDYIVDVQGGPRTVMCGPDVSVSFSGKADCLMDNNGFAASCPATVADAEACAEGTGADPCGPIPASCAVFFTCAR